VTDHGHLHLGAGNCAARGTAVGRNAATGGNIGVSGVVVTCGLLPFVAVCLD